MSDIDWTAICDDALRAFTLASLPPTLSLPALPHAVTLFLERANRPNVEIRELVSIIETDSGLTLELLRHVNSAYVGLKTKARSALQALMLLGLKQSRMFLIATGMRAAIQARQSKLVNQKCFWNATLQKALFARQVAGLLKTDQELAFSAALLQDYLLPVLTNDLFEPYLEFVQTRERQPNLLSDFEQDAFGWNHALAGACLARRWRLPDDIVCCILLHHQGLKILADPRLGRSAAAAVAVSALLPDQLRQCFRGLEQLMLLQQKWPAFDLQALAAQVDKLHGEMGLGVQNDFPLVRRCRPMIGIDPYVDGSLRAVVAG